MSSLISTKERLVNSMKNILTIIKKELKRFFGDKRMLISLLLPGVIIFGLYTIMGQFIGNIGKGDANHEYTIYVLNKSESNSFKDLLTTDKYIISLKEVNESEIDGIKQKIKEKNSELLIVFEENFDAKVASSLSPSVDIYYNSTNDNSNEIYNYFYAGLMGNSIKETNYNYVVNGGVNEEQGNNLATKEDVSSQIITMIVPYVLIIFLFTGCMSIATESIAGEKERGTIATLLVTPTKRSEIALGKVIALSITAIVSSLATFVGVILSIPNMMSGVSGTGITLSMYGFKEIMMILVFIILSVLFFTACLTIVSTLAKSTKESAQYAMPIMVITMVIGVLSMSGNLPTNPALYLIPIYNLAMGLTSVFAGSMNIVNILLTVCSNILYIGLGVFLLTKLFDNEKIMFNK